MKIPRIPASSIWWTGLLVLGSCAEGPFGLARYNPYYIKEWQEDEKYTQTFHAKLDEIKQLANRAENAPAEAKEQFAQQLAQRLQREENTLLRQALIRSLGSCSGPTAYQTLCIYVGDVDADVRTASCEAFGKLNTNEAAEALANVIQIDQDLDVRLAAARELENYPGNAAAVKALAIALDDANPALQFRAVQSLKRISPRDVGDSVAAWREYVNSGDAFSPRRPPSLVERAKKLF